ncbi:MAG: serpin family protein [Cyanobacteriota bacterium]|nr:serpin family protein [Cyanobacteriota bacterium]
MTHRVRGNQVKRKRFGGLKILSIASVAILSLTAVGCMDDSRLDVADSNDTEEIAVDTPSFDGEPVRDTSFDPELTAANTKFAFKLFSQIQTQQSDRNIFISPASVAFALAMTYNGASGDTQAAMARTLEFQDMSLEEVNFAYEALKSTLENIDPNVELAIANALWSDLGIDFNSDFLTNTREFYQAEATELDFSQPDAPATINNWVAQNTKGKIDSIVDRIPPDTILFLINAIYFQGDWSEPFDPEVTAEQPFTKLDGTQTPHPLMSQTGDYQYLENETFQAVSLPYGNGQFSFYIFLPKAGIELTDFVGNLNDTNWETWIDEFSQQPGSIQIPKFELEYEITLNDTLKALGMDVAFDRTRADFSAMRTPPPGLAIDRVKHKTFVEVNETGTEAAASTSVGAVTTSAPAFQEPFSMVVDRPFFCAIRENRTQTIVFMGSIVDPQLADN